MPIIRSGYRSPEDTKTLQALYGSSRWKAARKLVLARAGGYCEFCHQPPKPGQPLDVVHLVSSTLDLIRSGADPCDLENLAAGHRACHRGFSSGRLERPRPGPRLTGLS
jgi:hypothetical protein